MWLRNPCRQVADFGPTENRRPQGIIEAQTRERLAAPPDNQVQQVELLGKAMLYDIPATRNELNRRPRSGGCHAVHFAGHGGVRGVAEHPVITTERFEFFSHWGLNRPKSQVAALPPFSLVVYFLLACVVAQHNIDMPLQKGGPS